MSQYEWLQEVCSDEPARIENIGHPWTIQRGGGPWTVATNGRVLVARAGDFGFPQPDEHTPKFDGAMALPTREPVTLPLATLRALATPWLAENIPDCVVCKNAGSVECEECNGEGFFECECCECGDEHERDCRECKGMGSTPCDACPEGAKLASEIRPVWIGSATFDLRLFAVPLSHLAGDTAEFSQDGPERPGFFWIGEWLLIVMPLRAEGGFKDAPRIELPTPVAAGSPTRGTE